MTLSKPSRTNIKTFIGHIIRRIRRNHGLEHATLHILSKRRPTTSLAGQSDYWGFWIIGDVSQNEVQESAQEALRRLQAGENQLAVHPFCGTNLIASALLGSLAVMSAFIGSSRRSRSKLERIPLAIALASLSLMFSRPVGTWLQEHITTSADVVGLQIQSIRPVQRGWMRAQRVNTRG
ncbi:MAG: DUF6391 domain-containing protein [Anaerolineales bacterium]